MTELEDALAGLNETALLARQIARQWDSGGPDKTLNDPEWVWWSAWLLHGDWPESSADELLAVSRASGVNPTELELEGWEQFWLELGLDNEPEVEQTASTDGTASAGWTQPPLPGLEEL